MGLTVIMLPFRAIGMLFGQEQPYQPIPQAPAASAASSGAASTVRGAGQTPVRRERQVEFYNGERTVAVHPQYICHLIYSTGGAETGSGTVVTAPPEDQ